MTIVRPTQRSRMGREWGRGRGEFPSRRSRHCAILNANVKSDLILDKFNDSTCQSCYSAGLVVLQADFRRFLLFLSPGDSKFIRLESMYPLSNEQLHAITRSNATPRHHSLPLLTFSHFIANVQVLPNNRKKTKKY